MARRYPQHQLSPDECGILDPRAGFLRTDRAVLSAVEVARANGAQVVKDARVREIRQVADGVRISTDTDSWTFDRVIVASGFGSGAVLPPFLRRHVHPKRLFLTWFTARDTKQFVPEAFPIFIRITGDRSLYGSPDGRRGDRQGHPGRPRGTPRPMPRPSPESSQTPRSASRSTRSRRSCRV